MSAPLKAGIAPDLDLADGFVLQFTALDATTGAVVSGVVVSSATLTVANIGGGNLDELFVADDPLWISIPVDAVSG